MAPIDLYTRQTTTTSSSSSDNCPNSLSGGAIAGIVIGSIAGTLLIIWLIRSCFLPGAPGNSNPDGGAAEVVYTSSAPPAPRQRRHRRTYRTGPEYVEYVEKSPARSARSRTRRSSVVSVSRPDRVYVA